MMRVLQANRPPIRQMSFDGALLAAATAGMLASLFGWGDNPVRVAGGLVLSLFSPGYALLKALFPAGSTVAERVGLSVPASIVFAVLVGGLVNATPFGLSGNLIVVLLWLCTVALLAIAYTRTAGQPASARRRWLPIGIAPAVVGGLVLMASGAWAASSLILASQTSPKPFTVLSVNGANGVQRPGAPFSVILDNQEGRPMVYDLQASVDGSVVAHTEGVRLESGSQYAFVLPILSDTGSGADVVAFRSGEQEPYRTIHVGGGTDSQ